MTEERKEEIYRQVMEGRLEGDIALVKETSRLPVLNTEYHTQYFYFGLCLRGYTLGQYDYHDFEFRAGDICWIVPDHVLSHSYASPDYAVLSLFINREYFHRLRQQGVLGKFSYLWFMPSLTLSPLEFETMHCALRMIGLLTESDNPRRDELIASQIKILTTIADGYLQRRSVDVPPSMLLHEELFERFYDAIILHHRESREVKFYADLLALTPKYFATVIKRTTGIAASEWINRYVLIEAKWLLHHERGQSIQQIAYHLGFSEQASFSRFFKSYEGKTPKEYREQK